MTNRERFIQGLAEIAAAHNYNFIDNSDDEGELIIEGDLTPKVESEIRKLLKEVTLFWYGDIDSYPGDGIYMYVPDDWEEAEWEYEAC